METHSGSNAPRRTASTGRRHSSTRESLLRFVEASAEPLSIATIAEATGLHENTVRGHLEHLVTDGYLTRERAKSAGPGRPSWLWRPVQREAPSPYATLASALAATIARTSANPSADAREAGRLWGENDTARLREEPESTARDAVIEVMRDQGFAPFDTGDEILLRRCPLRDAAVEHPKVVCAVHRGIVEGVLNTVGDDSEVTLVPFATPTECSLQLRSAS